MRNLCLFVWFSKHFPLSKTSKWEFINACNNYSSIMECACTAIIIINNWEFLFKSANSSISIVFERIIWKHFFFNNATLSINSEVTFFLKHSTKAYASLLPDECIRHQFNSVNGFPCMSQQQKENSLCLNRCTREIEQNTFFSVF